jgi:hypothetical protein
LRFAVEYETYEKTLTKASRLNLEPETSTERHDIDIDRKGRENIPATDAIASGNRFPAKGVCEPATYSKRP